MEFPSATTFFLSVKQTNSLSNLETRVIYDPLSLQGMQRLIKLCYLKTVHVQDSFMSKIFTLLYFT